MSKLVILLQGKISSIVTEERPPNDPRPHGANASNWCDGQLQPYQMADANTFADGMI